MSDHHSQGIGFDDHGRMWWICSCGVKGTPVGSLSVGGVVFLAAEDRASESFAYHVAQHRKPPAPDPAWPFPPSSYDYLREGVGYASKPITVDAEEVERILTLVAGNVAARKKPRTS